MNSVGKLVLGGVVTTAFVYVFLHHASQAGTVGTGAMRNFAKVSRTFQGS